MSPTKPPTRCTQCRKLHAGTGKCPACRKATATKRPSGHARGWTKRWAEFSRAYLRDHPTCVLCGQAAEHVDHITGDRNDPKPFPQHDVRSLCQPCHAAETARRQPGGWHRRGEYTAPLSRPSVAGRTSKPRPVAAPIASFDEPS